MIHVDVNKQFILTGRQNSCRTCPIALALNDAVKGEWEVNAFTAYRLDGPAGQNRPAFNIPSPLSNWIRVFDRDGSQRPCSFDLVELSDENRRIVNEWNFALSYSVLNFKIEDVAIVQCNNAYLDNWFRDAQTS